MSISSVASTAVSGLLLAQSKVAAEAQNIVNATTPGYKTTTVEGQSVTANGGGAGVTGVARHGVDVQGLLQSTSSSTDLAIAGDGFLAVQTPDGTTGYVRGGAFAPNADNQLADSSGNRLLDDRGQPISLNASGGAVAALSVGRDGTVTARLNNGGTANLGRLAVETFANPRGLDALSGNLFVETSLSGAPVAQVPGTGGAGTVESASLEQSTTDYASSILGMIAAEQAYKASLQVLKTSDQMSRELVDMTA